MIGQIRICDQGFIKVAHYYRARDEQTFETGPGGNLLSPPLRSSPHPHKMIGV
jgi:hypothetical protein